MIDTSVATPSRRLPPIRKLAEIAALALATFVPAMLVSNVVAERQDTQGEAIAAIERSWGPQQVVRGLTFMIPIHATSVMDNGKTTATVINYAKIAPKRLDTTVTLATENRRRGFFTVPVYTATIHLAGAFAVPTDVRGDDGASVALPDAGFLALGVSGISGVSGTDGATIGGASAPWQLFSGGACNNGAQALVVPVDLGKPVIAAARNDLSFIADLHLRGTSSLQLGAMAKRMSVAMKGAWPAPSFVGDDPPTRSTVARDGFDAAWAIDGIGDPGLVTSPCVVDTRDAASTLGVDLVEGTPIYRMVTRAAKYAPLLVTLAFAAYLAFELLTGLAIGLVQYALVAASLSLFALLLVAFGEFIGYTPAYLVSAAMVIGQASIFTASVVRSRRQALSFAALLSGLFGFIYVLLGLETFALVTGAVALFLVLSLLMALIQQVQAPVAT